MFPTTTIEVVVLETIGVWRRWAELQLTSFPASELGTKEAADFVQQLLDEPEL